MAWWNPVSWGKEIIQPLASLVDEVHTSDEEKDRLRNVLKDTEAKVISQAMDLQSQVLKAQQTVLMAEVSGTGLKAVWRPIVMLVFMALIVWHSVGTGLGFPVPAINPMMWTLIHMAMGGYVVGRSGEKAIDLWRRPRETDGKTLELILDKLKKAA